MKKENKVNTVKEVNVKTKKPEENKSKGLNSLALLFIIIIIAVIATYIIPSGTYERMDVGGRLEVDPDSFQFIESRNLTPFDVFYAVPAGMINAVTLIVGALLVGGGLELIQNSGAINVGISKMIEKVGLSKGNLILIFLYYVFALMGAFLGLIEGSIPFIPIAISIAIGLGYDSIVGVAIAMIGAISGFASGPTNPFTVGIAHQIAGLPIYSGIGFRVVVFIVLTLAGLMFVLRYASKIKKNPESSLVKDVDVEDLAFDLDEYSAEPFTAKHITVLLLLIAGIGYYVYGAVNDGWSFAHLGAIFLAVGVVSGFISGLGVNGIAEVFQKGAAGMIGGALTMGIAYGVAWVFTEAQVLDTIVYYLSLPLTGLPPVVTAIGMLIAIGLINMIIPSGSGKALIVMPIVLPIAQIVNIEPQVAILAYQFGDSITNLFTPLLGVLLLALGFGRVPFARWQRFVLPLVLINFIIACIFLAIAMAIGYS